MAGRVRAGLSDFRSAAAAFLASVNPQVAAAAEGMALEGFPWQGNDEWVESSFNSNPSLFGAAATAAAAEGGMMGGGNGNGGEDRIGNGSSSSSSSSRRAQEMYSVAAAAYVAAACSVGGDAAAAVAAAAGSAAAAPTAADAAGVTLQALCSVFGAQEGASGSGWGLGVGVYSAWCEAFLNPAGGFEDPATAAAAAAAAAAGEGESPQSTQMELEGGGGLHPPSPLLVGRVWGVWG